MLLTTPLCNELAAFTAALLAALLLLYLLLYRDLKPENLMFVTNDAASCSYNHVKLCDFGLAAKTRGIFLTRPLLDLCFTYGLLILWPRCQAKASMLVSTRIFLLF
jgi:serine/threonine protein kinase